MYYKLILKLLKCGDIKTRWGRKKQVHDMCFTVLFTWFMTFCIALVAKTCKGKNIL